MTAPKVTPYAPIDPDLGVEALRLLARRYQVERDVARAGERAATAMAADVAARVNGALEAYRVEVEAAMRDYCRLYDERVAEVAGLRARVALFDQLYSDRQAELEGQRDAAEVALSAARPVLTEGAARAMVERTWDETAGGVAEMHDAFTALLLRVAGPARPPCRVCDRPVGDHGPDPGNGTDFGIPGACDGYEPSDVDAGPVTADAVETCDSCHRTLGPDAEEQGEAGSAVLCGACIREARAESCANGVDRP